MARVAPLHSHTYAEGGTLQLRQRVEALDKTNKWLEAFVIELSDEQVKVHYKGWHVKFDEWLIKGGARIRPYGRYKFITRKREQKLWRVPGAPALSSAIGARLPAMAHSSGEGPGLGRTIQSTGKMCTGNGDDDVRMHLDASSTDDQHEQAADAHHRQIEELSDRYSHYIGALNAQHLKIVTVPGDGNCLFRSVAHQVYGENELHDLVRQRCLDYMEADAGFFSQFVEGGLDAFPHYLRAKRLNACWGDDPEIQAICELYNRPAEIWAYDTQRGARKLRTFHEAAGRRGPPVMPLRLSYYGGGHYDSVVDDKHIDRLLRSAPGEIEGLALASLAQRLTQASSSVLHLEEARRVTDAAATEQAALDLALQMSRRDHERYDWQDDDLETCLILSLEDSYSHSHSNTSRRGADDTADAKAAAGSRRRDGSGYVDDATTMGCDLGDSKGNDDEVATGTLRPVSSSGSSSSSSSSNSSSSNNGGGDARHQGSSIDVDKDSSSVPMSMSAVGDGYGDGVLRAVTAESEREYLERALLSSIMTHPDHDHGDDTQQTDEQLMEQVKRESMAAGPGGGSGFGLAAGSGAAAPADPALAMALKLSELTEEEALNLALQQSMGSSSTSTGLSPTMAPSSAGAAFAPDSDEDMLQAALAMSMQGVPLAQQHFLEQERQLQMLQRQFHGSSSSSGSSGGGGGGHSSSHSHSHNAEGSQAMTNEAEDEYLARAIEESLRNR